MYLSINPAKPKAQSDCMVGELLEDPNLGQVSSTCPPFTLQRDFKCFPDLSHYEISRNVLCNRIERSIKLAEKAAAKLRSKPITPDTVNIFRRVFGQSPDALWEISGMPRKKLPASAIVAYRFQRVAEALRTRETLYRCGPCKPGIGNTHPKEQSHPLDMIVSDSIAWAVLCKDEVWLCQQFWDLKPEEQIGTVLHEMFHLCYGLTCAWFQHDHKERKRNSAYCYEAFALSFIDGFSPDTARCNAISL